MGHWGAVRMSASRRTEAMAAPGLLRHAQSTMRQRVFSMTVPLLLACVIGVAVGMLAVRVL